MTDPISDMLIRIKNAQALSFPEVKLPFSKLKYEISGILEREGFLKKVHKEGRKDKKILKLELSYKNNEPAIAGFKRVSKPSRRVYLPFKKITKVKGGYGMAIISTPKGLMTNREAVRQKVGGEIICEVW